MLYVRSNLVKRVCIVAEADKKVQSRPHMRHSVACFLHKNGRISIFMSGSAHIVIEMYKKYSPQDYVKRPWLTATDVYEYI